MVQICKQNASERWKLFRNCNANCKHTNEMRVSIQFTAIKFNEYTISIWILFFSWIMCVFACVRMSKTWKLHMQWMESIAVSAEVFNEFWSWGWVSDTKHLHPICMKFQQLPQFSYYWHLHNFNFSNAMRWMCEWCKLRRTKRTSTANINISRCNGRR